MTATTSLSPSPAEARQYEFQPADGRSSLHARVSYSSEEYRVEDRLDRSATSIVGLLFVLSAALILAPPFVSGFVDDSGTLRGFALAAARSALINACLFVGELFSMVYFHKTGQTHVAANISAVLDVLFGPAVVISFFQQDFFGTLFFFLAMWHFLCDSESTRPTHILVVPWHTALWRKGNRTASVLSWFMSWLMLIHHFLVGAFKIGKDSRAFGDGQDPLLSDTQSLILYGGALSHLSYSMYHFGIPGHVAVRLFAVVCRLGGDVSSFLVASTTGTRVFMALDCCWMLCMIGSTLWQAALLKGASHKAEASSGAKGTPAQSPIFDVDGLAEESSIRQAMTQNLTGWLERRRQEEMKRRGTGLSTGLEGSVPRWMGSHRMSVEDSFSQPRCNSRSQAIGNSSARSRAAAMAHRGSSAPSVVSVSRSAGAAVDSVSESVVP